MRARSSCWQFAARSAVVAALMAAQPVLADDGGSAEIEVIVDASIAPRCGFAPGQSPALNAVTDLERAAQLSVAVKVDCNTPFAIGVSSVNGKLANVDSTDDGSGYAFSKEYTVSMAIDTDKGVIRSERCTSATLIVGSSCSFAGASAGEGLESDGGIAIGRDTTLKIDWPDQLTLDRRLAPGRYRDTLILIIGASA